MSRSSSSGTTSSGVTVVDHLAVVDTNNLTYNKTDFGAIPKFVDKSKVDFGSQSFEVDESFRSDVDPIRMMNEAERDFCDADKFAMPNESFSSCVALDSHVRVLNWPDYVSVSCYLVKSFFSKTYPIKLG